MKTIRQIAEQHGIAWHTAHRRIKRAGIFPVSFKSRGTRRFALYSEADLDLVIDSPLKIGPPRLSEGERKQRLAEYYQRRDRKRYSDEATREKMLLRRQVYYWNNRDKSIQSHRRWLRKNRSHVRQYEKRLRDTLDPIFVRKTIGIKNPPAQLVELKTAILKITHYAKGKRHHRTPRSIIRNFRCRS
jgi:hypothetical protein